MYEKVFDQNIQKRMDDFFVQNLAPLGTIKTFEKGEIIRQDDLDCIYVLLEGQLNQVMHSKEGHEIVFFRIIEGNIFGEMAFFEKANTFAVNKALSKGKFSVVNREFVESKLKKDPEIYNYFLISVIRKFRTVMFELSNFHFNDSIGRLADFIIRLYYTETEEPPTTISIIFTHEEIANRLGLNRITVTHGLKKFREEGFIDIQNRHIIIKNIEGLKKITNLPI